MERAQRRALNSASRVETPGRPARRDSQVFAECVMPRFSHCTRADRIALYGERQKCENRPIRMMMGMGIPMIQSRIERMAGPF